MGFLLLSNRWYLGTDGIDHPYGSFYPLSGWISCIRSGYIVIYLTSGLLGFQHATDEPSPGGGGRILGSGYGLGLVFGFRMEVGLQAEFQVQVL